MLLLRITHPAMKASSPGLIQLSAPLSAANVKQATTISCISDDSSFNRKQRDTGLQENSKKNQGWFSEWRIAGIFGQVKSSIKLAWMPITVLY
jgi:hypothetical protein